MENVGTRYSIIAGCIGIIFINFVACGAQLYNVSLKEDTDPKVDQAAQAVPGSATFGLHAPRGWSELPIRFRVGVTLSKEQQRDLQKAMEVWEIAAGQKLFEFEGVHDGVTGDSFKDLYSSLDDNINGHYLDEHWDKTGKPPVVLATTIWDNAPGDSGKISTADIRFNTNYYILGDSFALRAANNKEVVDMQTLALHELGHLLGLSHIAASFDANSIMTPSLYIGEGLANRRLSKGDIERIQRIYGCKGDACDLSKTLARIEQLDRQDKRSARSTVAESAH